MKLKDNVFLHTNALAPLRIDFLFCTERLRNQTKICKIVQTKRQATNGAGSAFLVLFYVICGLIIFCRFVLCFTLVSGPVPEQVAAVLCPSHVVPGLGQYAMPRDPALVLSFP